MVARLTPDQKAACSSHVGVKFLLAKLRDFSHQSMRGIFSNTKGIVVIGKMFDKKLGVCRDQDSNLGYCGHNAGS